MILKRDRYRIHLDDLTVVFIRKRMKTMRLKVHPPDRLGRELGTS